MKYIGWKILEDKDGDPRFIFCALDGSRKIELDTVLVAERKQVKDGASSTTYESGFHVVSEQRSMVAYSQRFKNLDNKVVVKVYYEFAKPKPTKGSLALLSKTMRLSALDWEKRVPLRVYKELKN